jgi:hypothetical protein
MTEHQENDGLGDFDLGQIGMQSGAFGSARILKFDTDHFVTREGEIVGPERELVALGLLKAVQKFVDKRLVDQILVPSGENVPDITELNEKAPRHEWGTGFSGQPEGPYSLVLVLKLLDAKTMDRFAFVTKSKGGAIAVGDLSDKCKIMRRFRGPETSPVVSCSVAAFRIARLNKTLKRPDFRIIRWINSGNLGGGGERLPPPEPRKPPAAVEPAPSQTPAPPARPSVTEALSMFAGAPPTALGEPVREPTLREEMNDEVPF